MFRLEGFDPPHLTHHRYHNSHSSSENIHGITRSKRRLWNKSLERNETAFDNSTSYFISSKNGSDSSVKEESNNNEKEFEKPAFRLASQFIPLEYDLLFFLDPTAFEIKRDEKKRHFR